MSRSAIVKKWILIPSFKVIEILVLLFAISAGQKWAHSIPPMQLVHALFQLAFLIGLIAMAFRKGHVWGWISFSIGVYGLAISLLFLAMIRGAGEFVVGTVACIIVWFIQRTIQSKRKAATPATHVF